MSSVKHIIPDLFINKYAPKVISDFELPDNIKNTFTNFINSSSIPNLVITGPHGVGKTEIVNCLVTHLLHNNIANNLLMIDSTDDRAIKEFHYRVENFCKIKTANKTILKLVILDKADSIGEKMQQIITQMFAIADELSHKVNFIFTCNDSSKIIDSIQSNCTIIRFTKLDKNNIINKLSFICDKEKITYTAAGLESIYYVCDGDMRKAINSLQLVSTGLQNITPDNVYKLCDKPNPIIIKSMLIACVKKDFKSALEVMYNLINKGYSSSDIIINVVDTLKYDILNTEELNDSLRINFTNIANRVCLNITKGVDSNMQLTGCVAEMCLL